MSEPVLKPPTPMVYRIRVTKYRLHPDFAAGADLVQIYTGLIYHGAPLVRDAALAIKR